MRLLAMAVILAFVMALAMCLPGCGNVNVSGDAATALERSCSDSLVAARKADDANVPLPVWAREYLGENYKQWRSFVRANKRDQTWGPLLPGEALPTDSGNK